MDNMKKANLYAVITDFLMNGEIKDLYFKRENEDYVYYSMPFADHFYLEVEVTCRLCEDEMDTLDLPVKVRIGRFFKYFRDKYAGDSLESEQMEVNPRVGNIIRKNLNKQLLDREFDILVNNYQKIKEEK